ncbi:MAG: hypothetical protein FJ215_13650 [Ignavibacteria bacterium]|nr:hypothetical protein [Ignavibacteria bacterium]
MTGLDLYAENQCRRCGKMKLRNASFCPHCGYVHEETWFDRLKERLGASGEEKREKPTKSATYSVLLTLLVAGFFLYQAIWEESLPSLIAALITLVYAFRAWLSTRNKLEEVETPPARPENELDDIFKPVILCEKCNARIEADTIQCPKCGMVYQ